MQVLGKENLNSTLSIYVHIPFCRSKCPYCDFNSVPVQGTASISPSDYYIKALLKELHARSVSEGLSGHALESLYLGGGTPSLLSPEAVALLIEGVEVEFGALKETEVTIEVNPGTLNGEYFLEVAKIGVNRVSIGVQSFSDFDLKALGRAHTTEDALNVFYGAREAGFANIGIDLIFGLPGQSLKGWMKNLEKATELAPEHLSIYGLTLHEGTPFARHALRGELKLSREEELAEMFLAARHHLTANGYEHYEISNYALPGLRSRHNQRYWQAGKAEWLGLGAGAHSYLFGDTKWGIRSWNETDPARFCSLIGLSGSATAGSETLSVAEARVEALHLGLRTSSATSGGVLREGFYDLFGLYPEDALTRDSLFTDGLLAHKEGRILLTERGLLLSDEVY